MSLLIQLIRYYLLKYGVWGIAIGMMLESMGIPMASLALELTSGTLILNNKLPTFEIIIISDMGLVAGSVFSYFLGQKGFSLIKKRKGKELFTENEKRDRQIIEKYGPKFFFFAQLLGPLRTWASYPAGALRVDFKKFVLYTALGGLVYSTLAVYLSVKITSILNADFKKIEDLAIRYLPLGMLFAFIITILFLYFFFRPNKKSDIV